MEHKNKETRAVSHEMRAVLNGDGKRMIVGYAAVYNSETLLVETPIGKLYEKIAPGAFDEVLDQDVRALFNHDPNQVLGRTKAGTLKLSVDDHGLKYEITPPDTQLGKDLLESINRGDISQSSFGFKVKEHTFEQRKDGSELRTIKKVETLFDISPVTYPAYDDTAVAMRGLAKWKAKTHRNELRAKEIELLLID